MKSWPESWRVSAVKSPQASLSRDTEFPASQDPESVTLARVSCWRLEGYASSASNDEGKELARVHKGLNSSCLLWML